MNNHCCKYCTYPSRTGSVYPTVFISTLWSQVTTNHHKIRPPASIPNPTPGTMELTGTTPMFSNCLQMWPKVFGTCRGSTNTTLQQFFLGVGYRWAAQEGGKTSANVLLSAKSQVQCTEIVYIRSTPFRPKMNQCELANLALQDAFPGTHGDLR